MTVVSTTLCYPSPSAPARGIFIQRRLSEIRRLMPLKIVAPVPWFPGLRNAETRKSQKVKKSKSQESKTAGSAIRNPQSAIPNRQSSIDDSHVAATGFVSTQSSVLSPGCGAADEPPVWRPRMFYLPGVAKSLDGRFYARAFEYGLAMATQGRRPALIDAHFVWPDGVGAWRVARKLGMPFVCTIRGKLVSQIAERSKRRQIRQMLLSADGLIAVSRSLADLADEVAGRSLGVRVIPNAVDTGLFRRFEPECGTGVPPVPSSYLGGTGVSPVSLSCGTGVSPVVFGQNDAARPSAEARTTLGWSHDARYVVSVGHLQALKGFHRLVEVWPDVRRQVGDVRLILVGGTAGEPGFERLLRRQIEGVGAATPRPRSGALEAGAMPITLTGPVEQGRIAAMLNAADVFVLASRSEGWCNAIAEALACGCPVVATEVGGNREVVHDDLLGRLVPFGDRAALTEAICSALLRQWDRRAIAAAGGRREWQQVARECVDLFESVM